MAAPPPIGPVRSWVSSGYPQSLSVKYPGGWRNSTGDGDCFYWAFIYGLLLFPDTRDRWITNLRFTYAPIIANAFVEANWTGDLLANFPQTQNDGQQNYPILVNQLRNMAAVELDRRTNPEDEKYDEHFTVVLRDVIMEKYGDVPISTYIYQDVLREKSYVDHPVIRCFSEMFQVNIHIESVSRTGDVTVANPSDNRFAPERTIYVVRRGVHYNYLVPPPSAPRVQWPPRQLTYEEQNFTPQKATQMFDEVDAYVKSMSPNDSRKGALSKSMDAIFTIAKQIIIEKQPGWQTRAAYHMISEVMSLILIHFGEGGNHPLFKKYKGSV